MPDLPDHLPDLAERSADHEPDTAGVPNDAYLILSRAEGPLRRDEIASRLIADGTDHTAAAGAAMSVSDHAGVHVLADDRVIDVWVALEGARVAHRLTAEELEHGVLVPGADLLVLADLFDPDDGDLFLGAGIHLQEVDPLFDTDLLTLYDIPVDAVPPDGAWLLVGAVLDTSSAGHVIVVAVDGRDARLVGPVAETEAGLVTHDAGTAEDVASALRAGWRRAIRSDTEDPEPGADQVPIPVADLALEILVVDPWVFGPGSAPFTESIEHAGWVTSGDVVGTTEADLSRWELMIEASELAAFYRLDQDQAVALAHLLALFDQVKGEVEPGPGPAAGRPSVGAPTASVPERDHIDLGPDAAITLSWLADADVASAFVSQAIGIRVDHAPALFQFAVNARPQAPKAAEAATLWLEAKALGRLTHAVAAAERLDEAVRLDRSFVPLLLDAANLASDRGDAESAIRFARAAGLDDHDDFVRTLTELVPTAPPGLGRNEPCFCGSGRKYKHCHLGRHDLDLDQRAGWLYRKALEWIQDTPWRLRLLEIAEAYAPEEDDEDVVLHLAVSEPFIADLAFSDDGAWAEFVADRGILLPDDERELATRWSVIGRSVYEIVAVQPGTDVTVRDLRGAPDAGTVAVAERSFSNHATVGEVILARILPAGTTQQFFGGIISLGADEHDDVVDALDAGATGTELAELLGGLRGGPRLTNTEGEPLVFCGATYALADAAAARAALERDPDLNRDRDRPTDGEAEGIEPFDAAWIEPITIDGRDWIRARYTLRADELVLEANSEARMARARQRVETSIDGAELIHEEQRPLDELADTAPFDPRTLLGSQPDVSSELQAVLDELGRSAE